MLTPDFSLTLLPVAPKNLLPDSHLLRQYIEYVVWNVWGTLKIVLNEK